MRDSWTEADFEGMSWHDNGVHGVRIVEGEYGAGELILDIDYILEWICPVGDGCRFRVAPAELRFHHTTDLRIALDYASASAALTPFCIDEIRKVDTTHPGGTVFRSWTIGINWPVGEIAFNAEGFVQRLTGTPVVHEQQSLSAEQRERIRTRP